MFHISFLRNSGNDLQGWFLAEIMSHDTFGINQSKNVGNFYSPPKKKVPCLGWERSDPSKQKETIGRISKRVTNIEYSFTPELLRKSKPC